MVMGGTMTFGIGSDTPTKAELAFPWAISFVLHMGLGLLMLFAVFVTRQSVKSLNDREQIIIPVANLGSDPGNPGGVPNPGNGGDPTRDAAQNRIKTLQANGWSETNNTQTNVKSFLGGDSGEAIAGIIANGSGGSLGGTGKGGLGGEGGGLAPYGTPGGGTQAGPKGNFYGTGGNAYKIVYILDRSGGMASTFRSLRSEVSRSVTGLQPIQSFAIVMVGTYDDAIRRSNYQRPAFVGEVRQLVKATRENKDSIIGAMDKINAQNANDGTLQPFEDSFKMAFDLKPQLVYFLTDGNFDPQLLDAIKKLNKDKKVHINTIAYGGSKDDTDTEQAAMRKQLNQMANENGGKYSHVSDDELWE